MYGPKVPWPEGVCTTLFPCDLDGSRMGRPILTSQISRHLGDAYKGIHAETRRSTATPGRSNGASPHATPRDPTPQVPDTHVPMRPWRPPSSPKGPLLHLPIPTFINLVMETIVVYVLKPSFVTGLNLYNSGMRIAFVGGMSEACLTVTRPNASAEDRVRRNERSNFDRYLSQCFS